MAKGRIAVGGVDGGSVFVEGSVCFSDAEVMGRPVDFGDGWVWEALPDLLWVEQCRRHDVGVAGWWGVFGVYVGWDFTAMGGGPAVTTVNRRKLVDRNVVTSLISIATGSVERGKYSQWSDRRADARLLI